MTVSAPPRPPWADDREALFEEARRRQRRRQRRLATLAVTAAAAGLAAYVVFATDNGWHPRVSDGSRPRPTARRCPGVDLGTVAFVRDGALATVEFRRCRTRVLLPTGVVGPLEFSGDGRYIAFNGGYVSASGGPVQRTHGLGTWSPHVNLLAVGTPRGGVQLLAPDGGSRTLLRNGWGATTFVFSPDGRALAVSRSLYSRPSIRPPYHQEIWLVDVASGRRQMLFEQPREVLAPPWLYGFSPDGRWLIFWEDTQNSASLAADGLPLNALKVDGGRPIQITVALRYRDFVTWCGNKLVFVISRGGRRVTLSSGIATAAAPQWRPRTILPPGGPTSWNSVACPTGKAAAQDGGRIVVAAGPSSDNPRFGQEHRSLWLAAPTQGTQPRLLSRTARLAGETDELPMWSGDGRWIVFVRTKQQRGIHARGSLYAIGPLGDKVIGPIAAVGRTGNYYGAYGWRYQIDWHR